jgi:hypothetical protein
LIQFFEGRRFSLPVEETVFDSDEKSSQTAQRLDPSENSWKPVQFDLESDKLIESTRTQILLKRVSSIGESEYLIVTVLEEFLGQ